MITVNWNCCLLTRLINSFVYVPTFSASTCSNSVQVTWVPALENLINSVPAVSEAVCSCTIKVSLNVDTQNQSFILVNVTMLSYAMWDSIQHIYLIRTEKKLEPLIAQIQVRHCFFQLVPGKYSWRYFWEKNNYLCNG